MDSFFTLTETSLHSVTFWLAVSVFSQFLFFYTYICRCCEGGGLSSCLTSLRDQILTEHSAVGMARGTISSLRMQGSDVSWIRQINTVWSFIESPPSSSVCYKYLFSIQAAAAQFRQSIVYEYALIRRCFFFFFMNIHCLTINMCHALLIWEQLANISWFSSYCISVWTYTWFICLFHTFSSFRRPSPKKFYTISVSKRCRFNSWRLQLVELVEF